MYAFFGDLHLYTKLNRRDYLESLKLFLQPIKESKEVCHGIFVCGDMFDAKGTDDDDYFGAVFIIALACNNCGKNGKKHVPVYFIEGTFSHDLDQYRKYIEILDQVPGVEVHYYNETCFGELHSGASILYLPQLYNNFDYTPYFKDKHYNIIIGHGPISSETKSPCNAAGYEIVHSSELLGDISDICVFGHYHGYYDFGNNVYYCGPWLRWKYGEPEKRVFFYCDDNFKPYTIDNPVALEYETIDISSPEQLRECLSHEIKNPHRFVINSIDQSDIETYHGIMTNNKKNDLVTFKIQKQQPIEVKVLTEKEIQPVTSFVEPVDSLIQYIKDNYSLDTEKKIKEYVDIINKNQSEDNV